MTYANVIKVRTGGGGVHTKFLDPRTGGGVLFFFFFLDFQFGIDTKFGGGCPNFQKNKFSKLVLILNLIVCMQYCSGIE